MTNRPLFVFDIETTGLDYRVHGIIDISFILVGIDGSIKHKETIKLNPFKYGKIKASGRALDINGYSVKEIKELPSPYSTAREFLATLRKYSGGKQYIPVGFNASAFDKPFLQEWLDIAIPNTYYTYLDHKVVDVFEMTKWLQHLGIIDTGRSQTLKNVAKHFSITHTPHRSASDGGVTYELYKMYTDLLNTADKRVLDDDTSM